MKRLIVVCLAVFVLGGAHSVFAGWGCLMMDSRYWDEDYPGYTTPNYHHSGRNMSQMWTSFDYDALTSQQKKELRALNKKFEKKGYGTRKNLQALRLELHALKLKDNSSPEKIEAKREEIRKIETELEKLYEEYKTEVKKILPEELADELSDWSGYWHCHMWH
jgi:Spy/CpxP family protein refolding chaperone